jgi:BON domain
VTMNRNWSVLAGLALGAGMMFLLDPGRGRRRRALIRDKAYGAARRTGRAIDAGSRHFAYRTQGVAAELKGRIRPDRASDRVVTDRVRSALGRAVSHPHAIDVSVQDGRVQLSGPILASEVDAVISTVGSVRGVSDVENHLDVHDSAENTPALQGGRAMEDTGNAWTLGAKLLVSVAGAVALGAGLARASSDQGAMPEPLQ